MRAEAEARPTSSSACQSASERSSWRWSSKVASPVKPRRMHVAPDAGDRAGGAAGSVGRSRGRRRRARSSAARGPVTLIAPRRPVRSRMRTPAPGRRPVAQPRLGGCAAAGREREGEAGVVVAADDAVVDHVAGLVEDQRVAGAARADVGTWYGYRRSRNASTSGPETMILPSVDTSPTETRSRTARYSRRQGRRSAKGATSRRTAPSRAQRANAPRPAACAGTRRS